MKDIVKMVVVLTAICFVAALALSQVYAVTKEPIAKAKRLEKLAAIKSVLPAFDNNPDQDVKKVGDHSYYEGTKDGQPVGYAIEAVSHDGYSGDIKVLFGVLPDGEMNGLVILDHKETPGLGQKIEGQSWRDSVIYKDADHKTHRTLSNSKWNVKKDGGDIDQISGATISPRAVVGAVYDKLKSFDADKGQLGSDTTISPADISMGTKEKETVPVIAEEDQKPVEEDNHEVKNEADQKAAVPQQVNP